jgi:acyl dehydratase
MTHVDWKLLYALLRQMNAGKMNRALIGKKYQAYVPPITSTDIAAFADATNDTHPAYRQPPFPAPPLMLSKLMYPMIRQLWMDPELRLNILRGVYAHQHLIYHEPLCVGDFLTIVMEIINFTDTPAGELLEVSQQGFVNGRLSIEGTSGFIVRAKRKTGHATSNDQPILKELFRIEIPTKDGQQLKFAAASGDYNFIHTNSVLAKMAGLPRTIMHGACVLAISCNTLVEHVLENDLYRLTAVGGRFGKPTLPGDVLTLIAFESANKNEILFEVRNSLEQAVFKKGIFRYR